MRCFLCIEITDSTIISKIVQFQEELKSVDAKIKFVEMENLHFTLKFLGEVDSPLIEEIYTKMKKAPFSAFSLTLQNVGTFPGSNPRVIWVGISEGREQLAELSSFLDNNLKDLGFKREKRKFSPHVTIGRVRYIRDRKALNSLLEHWHDKLFGTTSVSSFQLKKSILTAKGPIYSILKEIKT